METVTPKVTQLIHYVNFYHPDLIPHLQGHCST